MADWIKINHTLLRSTKLRSLMRTLRINKHEALGLAVHWFVFLDEQTTDGNTHLTPEEVDDELGVKGAANAFSGNGWSVTDKNGFVHAVDFDKHCGATAKARALAARRASKCKAKKQESETAEIPEESAEKVTVEALPEYDDTVTAKPLTEKKRKEKNIIDKPSCTAPNKYTVVKRDDEQPEAQRLEAPAPERARSCKPLPADAEEVQRFMAASPLCSIHGDELARCAASFFDTMEGNGWTTGPHAAPVADWHALARKFLRSWQTRSASDAIAARKKAAPATRYRSETKPDYSL